MMPNGAIIDGYHTFDDIHMIPKHKLTVNPAIPKLIRFSIPGVDGIKDFTTILTGRPNPEPPAGDYEGQWEFRLLGDNYLQDYSNCLALFNGEVKTCILDDLPGTTYRGRFSLVKWQSYEGYSDLTVSYHFYNGEVAS